MLETIETATSVAAFLYGTPALMVGLNGAIQTAYHTAVFRNGLAGHSRMVNQYTTYGTYLGRVERGAMPKKELIRHAQKIERGRSLMRWAPLWPVPLIRASRATWKEARALAARHEREERIRELHERVTKAREQIDTHNRHQKDLWEREFYRGQPKPKRKPSFRDKYADKYGGQDVNDVIRRRRSRPDTTITAAMIYTRSPWDNDY